MMRAALEAMFVAMFCVGVVLYTYGVYARAAVSRRRTDRFGAPFDRAASAPKGGISNGCS